MKTIFTIFSFSYKLAGHKKFLLLVIVMIFAVGLDGLSISFILPILQGIDSDNQVNQIFKQTLTFIGVEYTLLNLLIFLIVIISLRSILLIIQYSFTEKIMSNMLVKLRQKISKDIFELNYLAFLKYSSGYLNNALVTESQRVVFSFKMVSNLMVQIFFAILYVGIPFSLKPGLVLILLLTGCLLFPIMKIINAKTEHYSILTSAHSAGLMKIFIQSLNYFKYLKSTAKYPNVLKQISRQSKKLGHLQFRLSILSTVTQHGFEPFIVIAISVIIFYFVEIKGQNIIEHAFILYLLNRAMGTILGLQKNFRKLLSTWGSIKVVNKIQNELINFKEKKDDKAGIQKISFNQPILFDNVSFTFNGSSNVLNNITLDILPYSTVAFVGESGAGKSTLVNLLIGLISPTEGNISIGDMNYESLNRENIRKNVGYITQENIIFNDTIYNNITLWDIVDRDKGLKSVQYAAKKAKVKDFIESLPQKYDSLLGEGGINISGGQRQRICIARELYKDAKLLIFDEATSALDTKTEKEIQRNIEEIKGQKTIVIIAHRLSTVKNCDKIFVLKNGVIVEEGTYDELYYMNNEFKKMVDLQNS